MRTLFVLLTALTIGCGVSDDVAMSDLDESQVESLCGELAGDREVTCSGEGYELTIEVEATEEECIADYNSDFYASCDATVGDVRACSDAWSDLSDEEICSLEAEYPEECSFLLECLAG